MNTFNATLTLSVLAAVLMLPTNAFADDATSKIWVKPKTAISASHAETLQPQSSKLIIEDAPELIVPLNTDVEIGGQSTKSDLSNEAGLSEIDILDKAQIQSDIIPGAYVGMVDRDPLDTIQAQQERAATPDNYFVRPLVPLAAAGVSTEF